MVVNVNVRKSYCSVTSEESRYGGGNHCQRAASSDPRSIELLMVLLGGDLVLFPRYLNSTREARMHGLVDGSFML